MAEIQATSSAKQKGVSKCKKLSTRVDLTPMVDLGFLLITFFIFTTVMSKPMATNLVMPSDTIDNQPPKIPESKVLQLLLVANDKVLYYFGNDATKAEMTNFSATGLRQIIQQKQIAVAKQFGSKSELVIMIKPTNHCNLKNLTDVLDEIQINTVTRYVLSSLTQEDNQISSLL